jgi:ABC-type dipeptide/oligopeptide/nickel transport system permease component
MEAVNTYKNNWWGFISKRLFIAVIAFFIISFILFLLIHTYFYDPFSILSVTPEQLKALAHKMGWDRPLIIQYFQWIGNFFTGNWGRSLTQFESGIPWSKIVPSQFQ